MNNKLHVKTGDTVVLLTGKYKDKYKDDKKTPRTGKVLEVSPKEGKVIVEGINVVTKHVKPRKMGETGRPGQSRGPHLRLQGDGCLPQVQQAHQNRQPDPERRQKSPRLQKVRRNFLSEEENSWLD